MSREREASAGGKHVQLVLGLLRREVIVDRAFDLTRLLQELMESG